MIYSALVGNTVELDLVLDTLYLFMCIYYLPPNFTEVTLAYHSLNLDSSTSVHASFLASISYGPISLTNAGRLQKLDLLVRSLLPLFYP